MYGSKSYFSWVVSNIYTFVHVDCSYWREATLGDSETVKNIERL